MCNSIKKIIYNFYTQYQKFKIDKKLTTKANYIFDNVYYNITSLDIIFYDYIYSIINSKLNIHYKSEVYFWGIDLTKGIFKTNLTCYNNF